jgi:hypothetical protein
MRWVTRAHVHLDRVACAWLILRFVDPEAELEFVSWGSEHQRSAAAIPFGLPGVELGTHDEAGTTFDKFLRKYSLDDPALTVMAGIIAAGVHHAMHRGQPEANDATPPAGIGLDVLSVGLMLLHDDDLANITASLPMYDALYVSCQADALQRAHPELREMNFIDRAAWLRTGVKLPSGGSHDGRNCV